VNVLTLGVELGLDNIGPSLALVQFWILVLGLFALPVWVAWCWWTGRHE